MSPQRGVGCRLTVPQRRGAEAGSGGTGLAAEQGGHSAGKALQNRSPRRRRRRQQPMPPPLPNHPSDTRAAASQHVGRSRCRNRGGLLGTNTDRTRHKETGRGVCCDRLARTQIVEAEAAATVDPPEAREALQEASPDTLCATGSLAPTRYPPQPHFQTNFRVWQPPFPHPRRREPPVFSASSFRLPQYRHALWGPAPSQGE